VIDFDAFRAEQKAEPLEFIIGGNTYILPSALPASLALDVIRRNALDSEAELDPESLIVIGNALFAGKFDRVLDENQVTMDEIPELFRLIFAQYSGEPEAPNPESLPESTPAKKATSR
jgi:hypothetical protein